MACPDPSRFPSLTPHRQFWCWCASRGPIAWSKWQVRNKYFDAAFRIQATWDDAAHLSAEAKAKLLASIPPYQREVRSKGIPQLAARTDEAEAEAGSLLGLRAISGRINEQSITTVITSIAGAYFPMLW